MAYLISICSYYFSYGLISDLKSDIISWYIYGLENNLEYQRVGALIMYYLSSDIAGYFYYLRSLSQCHAAYSCGVIV